MCPWSSLWLIIVTGVLNHLSWPTGLWVCRAWARACFPWRVQGSDACWFTVWLLSGKKLGPEKLASGEAAGSRFPFPLLKGARAGPLVYARETWLVLNLNFDCCSVYKAQCFLAFKVCTPVSQCRRWWHDRWIFGWLYIWSFLPKRIYHLNPWGWRTPVLLDIRVCAQEHVLCSFSKHRALATTSCTEGRGQSLQKAVVWLYVSSVASTEILPDRAGSLTSSIVTITKKKQELPTRGSILLGICSFFWSGQHIHTWCS